VPERLGDLAFVGYATLDLRQYKDFQYLDYLFYFQLFQFILFLAKSSHEL
jgi:hypothetical protein